MRPGKIFFLSLLTAAACGGISDPTHHDAVATVSGALTGSAPVPNATHVALVWQNAQGGGVAVGADVPVVNGHFTMNLAAPPDGYFRPTDSTSSDPPQPVYNGGGSSGGSGSSDTPTTTTTKGGSTVGGQITEDMTAAFAGFVVYVDTNGNGQLDLAGSNASSPDQLLGGNKELMLVYLKGGGALDYEKLRDKSGILPTAGFNLAWTEGRWLPLDLVELKLSSTPRLPTSVCYGGEVTKASTPDATFSDADGGTANTTGNDPSSGPMEPSAPDGGTTDASTGTTYPDPSDPNLVCAPDGRSFSYNSPNNCPPPPPSEPAGLCGSSYAVPDCAPSSGYGEALASGAPVPAGWPCPVPNTKPPVDAGTTD